MPEKSTLHVTVAIKKHPIKAISTFPQTSTPQTNMKARRGTFLASEGKTGTGNCQEPAPVAPSGHRPMTSEPACPCGVTARLRSCLRQNRLEWPHGLGSPRLVFHSFSAETGHCFEGSSYSQCIQQDHFQLRDFRNCPWPR